MFLTRKKQNWTRLSDIKASWKCFHGINPDKLLILETVWKKEVGQLYDHCRLLGISKNCLMVKTTSSVASNEIMLRSRQLISGLNKYFKTNWIKSLKIVSEI